MKTEIQQLEELIKVQTSNGNWNYDPYMHGMANGMILSLAILKGEEPVYLDAPNEWICYKKVDGYPVSSIGINTPNTTN